MAGFTDGSRPGPWALLSGGAFCEAVRRLSGADKQGQDAGGERAGPGRRRRGNPARGVGGMEHARRGGRTARPRAGPGASHGVYGLTPRARWGTSASHLGCFEDLGSSGRSAAVPLRDRERQHWPSTSHRSDPGALRPSSHLFNGLGSMGHCRAPSKKLALLSQEGKDGKMGCTEGRHREGRVQTDGRKENSKK